MLFLPKILSKINKTDYKLIIIDDINKPFNFNDENNCFILSKGEVLSYGENNYTQILKPNDPINFAECIVGKSKFLRYRLIKNVELVSFSSEKIRNNVNNSGALAKTIIKYSINRVFNRENSKSTYYFEDDFLNKNFENFKILTFNKDKYIFKSGFISESMYFIENGAVQLLDKFGNHLASLKKGDCFGESSLLRGSRRNNSAISIKDTKLTIINFETIEKEIKKENFLVQLAIYSVLRKLELMNLMRNPRSSRS